MYRSHWLAIFKVNDIRLGVWTLNEFNLVGAGFGLAANSGGAPIGGKAGDGGRFCSNGEGIAWFNDRRPGTASPPRPNDGLEEPRMFARKLFSISPRRLSEIKAYFSVCIHLICACKFYLIKTAPIHAWTMTTQDKQKTDTFGWVLFFHWTELRKLMY